MMSTSGDPSPRLGSNPAPAFPKRFYQTANVAARQDGFALMLDGRLARTPAKSPLALPTREAAQAVANEWTAVVDVIDPRSMPMTRLANSVIDGVSVNTVAVLEEVVRYATSDLVVYRASDPVDLVRAQAAAWDPIVAWSRTELGAPLILTEGIVFVAQPPATLDRLAATVRALIGEGSAMPFRLGALHVITSLTGSALLGLAVAAGRVSGSEAWAAAHVDEDHQIARWGEDAEAAERRARRWIDMRTAAHLLQWVPQP